MIKAKMTIYDDETDLELVKDQVVTPVYEYSRLSALERCYVFKFKVIEQKKIEVTIKENAEGESK